MRQATRTDAPRNVAGSGGRSARGRMKITPMLEQYLRIKQEHPDALLFFRLGDFYEMFFEDAERAARCLDITLTTRSRKDEVPIPMCGVPHHAVQTYVARLLNHGIKVALCDQMEDPAAARGIVERAVVRVLTPGTLTEEEYLDPKQPNYLAAVHVGEGESGVVCAELSTGEVCRAAARDDADLVETLSRLAPREVLLPAAAEELAATVRRALPEVLVSSVAPERFDAETACAWLHEAGADAVEGPSVTLPALGAVLWYLSRTHRASLAHLRAPAPETEGRTLRLDEASRRNLELLQTTRGERRGSLLWVLDDTVTSMGGRLLRQWLVAPPADPTCSGRRLDAVEELLRERERRDGLRKFLGVVGDLERFTARLTALRVGPRDMSGLAAALGAIAALRESVESCACATLTELAARLDPLADLRRRIEATVADDPPAQSRAGGVIRGGRDARVDELRELAHSGKRTISELEAAERKRTGIGSLKVRYNQVFGYTIEVTKPNLHLVPEDYRRKQTLSNAERFVTPELEQYEARVRGAEERLIAIEAELFNELVSVAAEQHGSLTATAVAAAHLDVLACLSLVAERNRYTRPVLTRGRGVRIEAGRHPVVEQMAGRQGFVPNDCLLNPDEQQILLLTGPNMAGKSTYLRQVALTVLLAQMGSFVPAASAEIGVVDRLFTRIGASDNLSGGESTFMVEMKETAGILSGLSDRSLMILDEIGRGTSTFDGISIAWAVAEYLHESSSRPLVLFATHYHELTDLARTQSRTKNFSVAVREWKGEVVFLRRVVPGAASQSYGIQVARLAGVPDSVITRAGEILANLERGELNAAGVPRLAAVESREAGEQLPLFASREEQLRRKLALIDVERMTPIDALTRLDELVHAAREAEGEET